MKKILLTTLTTIIFFNTSFSQLSFYSKDKLENTLSITLYDDIVNQFSGDRKALYQKFDKNLNSIEKKEMTWSPVRRIQRRDFSDYFDIGLSDGKKFSTYYTLTDEKNNIEAIQDEKGNVWELNKDFVPLIIDKKYHIGQRFQGGVIFYIDESGSEGLICSVDDLSYGIRWCNDKFIVTEANGVRFGDGHDNTKKIIKRQGNGNYAAKLCADYRGGGYSDWYLPSEAELDILYKRSFQVGKFQWKLYWSSTEIGGSEGDRGARAETFDFFEHGATSKGILSLQKDLSYPVRAIRNFIAIDLKIHLEEIVQQRKRDAYINDSIQIVNKTILDSINKINKINDSLELLRRIREKNILDSVTRFSVKPFDRYKDGIVVKSYGDGHGLLFSPLLIIESPKDNSIYYTSSFNRAIYNELAKYNMSLPVIGSEEVKVFKKLYRMKEFRLKFKGSENDEYYRLIVKTKKIWKSEGREYSTMAITVGSMPWEIFGKYGEDLSHIYFFGFKKF